MNRWALVELPGTRRFTVLDESEIIFPMRRWFRVATAEGGAEIAADMNATRAHANRIRGGDRSGLVPPMGDILVQMRAEEVRGFATLEAALAWVNGDE